MVTSHESNVATRQNQDMRTISSYAALLGDPDCDRGNLRSERSRTSPLLNPEFGWLVVVIGMLVLDVLTYATFRHRGWLGGAPATRSDGERPDQP